MSLFRKKPTEHPAADSGLKRCLSAFDLTLIGISAMVGGGIFVLIGITSATTAGPAVMLSFVIAGIACSFAALSYAELSTCIGGSGSAYGYA
ncbi:MAG: amino acid permease, partial [Gammaproteobacteria bacterium]|nr:amino acid permease [Gammaproteobacteria bacterium]